MLKTPKILWALILLVMLVSFNALGNNPVDDDDDDYNPEDNARVARIKFLQGDAQIKRADNDQWERAAENLPIIEGDEITTDKDTLIELQFDKNNYLRLAENSYLKIVNLRAEGIAVSISKGTLNLTILEFDKDKSYFEVDAPQSTVAIQKEGRYRIDAGDVEQREVRVIVSNWGEARVYSNDSGFTLKNGNSAKLFLDGTYAGEWETSRNSSYGDDFDEWTAERDALIERNLRNSYYNKYYDDSIYGADDLNDYGSWAYSQDYGYVWRPYTSSITRYSNWSPYRYGHWRWLPYHGWTWVNDEPWGWSTYHYGRWVYISGFWAWSPYSGYRRTRSYWRPAIVFITYVANNICWYPLPYNYGYYDYNRRYRRNWRRDRGGRGNNGNGNPTGTPVIPAENIARGNRRLTPTMMRVPRTGVVSIPAGDFGLNRKNIGLPPLNVADAVLKKNPVISDDSPPLLPEYKDISGRVSKDILIPNERRPVVRREVKIGASERKDTTPLDEKLRNKTIYGNRDPQIITRKSDSGGNDTTVEPTRRRTGVFDRKLPPSTNPETKRPDTNPNRQRSTNTSPTTKTETRKSPPVYTPPTRDTNQTERNERKSSPPPPAQTQPRRSEPTPPPRSEPRRSSPPRPSPPPQKSEPTQESKPAPPPSKSDRKSKDPPN